MDPAFTDAAFKERVTAAFDGLAAGYDTGPGGFFGPVSELHAMLLFMMSISPVQGIDVPAAAKPSAPAGFR